MGIQGGPDIVENGLVLYLDAGNHRSYPGSGTTWTDLSGNGNDGTLINGPTFDGENQGSLVFDGANDYGSIDNNTLLNPSEIAIVAWIVPHILHTGNFISKSFNSNYRFRVLSNGECSFIDRGGTNQLYANINYTPNKIISLSATGDGLGLKIYQNGILVASNNTAYGGATTSDPVYIGTPVAGGVTEIFDGSIYSLQVYNRALTPQEILQNYNTIKSRFGL